MSEEPERSRRVVDRLIDAQQEALDVTRRALDAGAEGLTRTSVRGQANAWKPRWWTDETP